jgi:hypothetical protein
MIEGGFSPQSFFGKYKMLKSVGVGYLAQVFEAKLIETTSENATT